MFGVAAPPYGSDAAIIVLVSTWVLGLAIVGAALALRATAWTAEATPNEGTVRGESPG